MKEIEIQNRLPDWIRKQFKGSDLLIEEEVRLNPGIETTQFRTDIVAVQSKSNVIHAFEIKSRINDSSLNSVLWQIDSLYGNYKWLVTSQDLKSIEVIKRIKEKGLGLLLYMPLENDFKIVVQPNYIDGNLIKYYPSINEKWINK